MAGEVPDDATLIGLRHSNETIIGDGPQSSPTIIGGLNDLDAPPIPDEPFDPTKTSISFFDPMIDMVIDGKYRIEELIGQGGMGSVYRGTQVAVNRPVAVKVLRNDARLHEDDDLVGRFKREAHATSRLRHPNTVSVIDFGETDSGLLYLVLELLEGAQLSEVIYRESPLMPSRCAAIGRQIAKSLSEAHQAQIIHRDLKPDNIFLCDFAGDPDFVKVMDFGIARLITDDGGMTRSGIMVGTPKYIAPEQALAKEVTPSADLYALGVILYEMLSGGPPFQADSAMAIALMHVSEKPRRFEIPGASSTLNDAWWEFVSALLVKDPKKRLQSGRDVAKRLKRLEMISLRAEEESIEGSGSTTINDETSPVKSTNPVFPVVPTPSPRSTVTTAGAATKLGGNAWWALAAGIGIIGLGVALAFSFAEPAPPESTASTSNVTRSTSKSGVAAGTANTASKTKAQPARSGGKAGRVKPKVAPDKVVADDTAAVAAAAKAAADADAKKKKAEAEVAASKAAANINNANAPDLKQDPAKAGSPTTPKLDEAPTAPGAPTSLGVSAKPNLDLTVKAGESASGTASSGTAQTPSVDDSKPPAVPPTPTVVPTPTAATPTIVPTPTAATPTVVPTPAIVPEPVVIAAAPTTSLTTLSSEPMGADVYLDNNLICTTPCEVGLTIGSTANLRFVKSGYSSTTRSHLVTSSGGNYVDVGLRRVVTRRKTTKTKKKKKKSGLPELRLP